MFILFFWIVFGGLVGWIVGILKDIRGVRPAGLYVTLGVIGGLLGGYGSSVLFDGTGAQNNDLTSMMFAIVGAVTIVILLATADRKHP